MKTRLILLQVLLLSLISPVSWARNDIQDYSIQEALSLEQAKEKLGNEIRFYFGNQKHGKIQKNYGEFGTNKKTNAFLKTDKQACTWAFLSAMIQLEKRAIHEGGNAVINIKSNYKNKETVSETTFQCGAGNVVAGVALKGTVVVIK